jgi:hypothetical protein
LEIIMCFTLNSAAEWAGSMFQVVVVVVEVVVVAGVDVGVMGYSLL